MPPRKAAQEDEQQDEFEIDAGEPDESWLDRNQAAVALNVSVMTVRRLQKEGILKGKTLPGSRGGKIVFDPEQVNGLVGSVATESATVDEMNAQTLVAAAVALSKQSGAHAERLLQLVEEPAGALLRMALEENGALRERIHQLEEDRIATFKMMEEMRSQQHQRELEQMQWYANNERKDSILKLVIDNGPKLMQQVVTHTQGPKMLESLSGLAQSLKPDQVMKLMDILDENQATTLAKVLDSVKQNEKSGEKEEAPHKLLE